MNVVSTRISADNTPEKYPSVEVEFVIAILPPLDINSTVHPSVPVSKSWLDIRPVPGCVKQSGPRETKEILK